MASTNQQLTQAQKDALPIYRDRWLTHGLSTEPANREQALAGLREVYAAANYTWPDLLFWVGSPVAGALCAYLLSTEDMSDRLKDALLKNDWTTWQAILDNLSHDQKNQVRQRLNEANFGQHEAGWLGFYDWYGNACGQDISKVQGHILIGQSCSFFWPYLEAIIVCDRPSAFSLDDRHRLHCPDGPALAYRDGFKIYSWHGLWVKEHVIMRPDEITAAEVQQETNAEIRRILLERLTPARYVEKAGLTPIDTDKDPTIGTLYRADLPGDEPLLMLQVQNGTPEPRHWGRVDGTTLHRLQGDGQTHTLCGRIVVSPTMQTYTQAAREDRLCFTCETEAKRQGITEEYRRFWLQVPERGGPDGAFGPPHPHIKTAKQANAWVNGLTVAELPEVRT